MLEQLYYSWPLQAGSQFQAASSGLANVHNERFRTIMPYLNYKLPQGTDITGVDVTKTPLSLVFADTGKERIILQKAYRGRDQYNRETHFVHLLAGLPEDFVAQDAIELWRSPFWKTASDTDSFSLPQVQLDDLKHQPGTLSERDLVSIQQHLPWLIQVYLTLDEARKIYISAPNTLVAALLWGLAHSVPRPLQQTLTFSTYEYLSPYEHNVTRDPVQIVCTSEPDADLFLKGYAKPAQWLPSECYSGKGVAIDCYSGKASAMTYVSQEIVDYSRYATDCFVQGRKTDFDDLLRVANHLKPKDTNEFLAIDKFYSPPAQVKALTPQEVTGLLSNRKLVTALLHQEKVQQAIIDLAIADPKWWNQQAAPALTKLRSDFINPNDQQSKKEIAALTAFGVQVAKALYAAMLHNQTRSSEILMRILYAITPPDKDVAPWLQLLQSFSEYMVQDKQFAPAKAFAWDFRSWLLQQWAYGSQYISDELIFPWLQLTWADFGNFLALPDIPDKWRQLALSDLLSHSPEPLPKQLAILFNTPKYQVVCFGVLKDFMRAATTQPAALRCFQKLVETRYGNKLSLLALLLEVNVASKNDRLTVDGLDKFLRAARMNDGEKIEMLQQHASLLLESDHETLVASLVDAINVYVDKLTVDKLLDKSAQDTVRTLDLLSKQLEKLPAPVAERLKAWIYVSYGIVRNPFVPISAEKKFLTTMSKAIFRLKLQTHKKYRESLYFVLVNSMKTNTELRCVYESFVPLLADRQTDLVFDLATFLGERYSSNLPCELLLPYVYEALTLATSMKATKEKEDFLPSLFKVLLQHVDREDFEKIEHEVAKWPSAYKKVWQQYGVPPEAKSLLRRVGDVGGSVVGGVVGGAKAIGGVLPPQQNASQVHESPKIKPLVPPIASEYNQVAPDVGQLYTSSPQDEPQSTVNGQPIYPQWIVMVYKLKGPYIEHRENVLKREFAEHQKKRQDIEWLLDEQTHMRNQSDIDGTLKLLEMDVIVQNALSHFSVFNQAQLDPQPLLGIVYKDLQRQYIRAYGNIYSEEDIKKVLLVFVRYRMLSEYFRNQNPPVRLRHWLEKQWLTAGDQGRIVRSTRPLPTVK